MDEYRLRDLIAKFSAKGNERSEITAALQRQLDRTLAEKQQRLVDNYGYMPEYGDMRSQYSPDMMNAPRGMMNWRDYQAEQERLAEIERQKAAAYLGNGGEGGGEDTYNYTFTPRSRRGYKDTPYYDGQEPTVDPNFFYDDETFYYPGTTTPETQNKETVTEPNYKQEDPTSYAIVDWAHRFKGPASFGMSTAYASDTGYGSTADDAIVDRVPGRAFVDNSRDLDGARTWAAGVTDVVNKNQAERNAAHQAQIKARQEAQSQAAAKAKAVRDAKRKALGY